MSVNFDKSKQLLNLKRQSLRLANILELPLNQIHILLAKYFYNENSISDVRKKIKSGKISGRLFLSAVAPDANEKVLEMFVNDFAEILISVDKSPISKIYKGNLQNLVCEVFSLDHEKLNRL